MATNPNEARLNLRMSVHLKRIIREAALHLAQSVNEFAVETLAQTARHVIQQRNVTELSARDRDAFLAMLDNARAQPNAALRRAAQNYRRQGA